MQSNTHISVQNLNVYYGKQHALKNITFDIPSDWVTNAVNGQTKYWIRIETSTVPVTNAEAYYIIPANNVPGLLAMSSSEVQNEDWKWCSYGSSIYVTI